MGKRIWTKAKIELLKAYLANPNYTYSDIAKKLKISIDSVEHAKRRYNLENVIEKKEEDLNYYQHYSGMINHLKNELGQTKPISLVESNRKKIGDTLNVHITDWHVGRLVKNEFGQVIYDVSVFKQMVKKFSTELLKLVDKYISKGTPITNVNVLSTGDICDGLGIFATQATLSEFAPPFQVLEATKAIESLILSFSERKLNVNFYGVKGNHGELRINGKNTDPNANWDLMLYLMLELWSQTDKRAKNVKIYYSELDYLNFVNRGWNYHLRHIAPNQSETSAGKAKFLGWAKQHKFDVLVYGHLHHWGAWDRSKITVIRGGALTAGDEFAETLAEESEPIQLIWGCNENRPVTFLYPLDLGKKNKE